MHDAPDVEEGAHREGGNEDVVHPSTSRDAGAIQPPPPQAKVANEAAAEAVTVASANEGEF